MPTKRSRPTAADRALAAQRERFERSRLAVGEVRVLAGGGRPSGEVVATVRGRDVGGFEFQADVVEADGTVVVSTVSVTAEAGGVTAAMMRAVPVGKLVAAVAHNLRFVSAVSARVGDVEAVRELERQAAAIRASSRPGGRPPLTNDFLRSLAEEYLAVQAELGGGRGVIPTLAQRRGDTPVATVQDWIRRASKEGFLTTAAQGKGGRLPGPRLRAPQAPKNGRQR